MSEEKVRDPVCNMEIKTKDAVAASQYNGSTYYFCAKYCKERFDKDPVKYTAVSNSKGSLRVHRFER